MECIFDVDSSMKLAPPSNETYLTYKDTRSVTLTLTLENRGDVIFYLEVNTVLPPGVTFNSVDILQGPRSSSCSSQDDSVSCSLGPVFLKEEKAEITLEVNIEDTKENITFKANVGSGADVEVKGNQTVLTTGEIRTNADLVASS